MIYSNHKEYSIIVVFMIPSIRIMIQFFIILPYVFSNYFSKDMKKLLKLCFIV